MHTIDIYRGQSLFVTIKPDDDSTQTKKIMGDNSIQVSFTDSRMIPFQINDYCTVFGEKYVLNSKPVITKKSQFEYDYTVTMISEGTLLTRVQYLFLGDDNSLKETDFSLMGNADTFMDLLMQNLQRIDDSWTLGEVIPTDYKNITFATDNCYNALSRIAETFETEFWLIGKTIHLTKVQNDTGNTYKHGKGKGLYEISPQPVEDGATVVTRLYAYGSDKNIPADYRNYSKRLRMTEGQEFVEQNTSKYGVIEFTKVFEDIYPHRTGRVSSVNATNPFQFIDADIDFDINDYLLPGTTAKVTFNTGQLSGYTLELKTFNNGTKTFTMLLNKDERSLDIPSDTVRPAIGDQYVLVDISMPDSYIEAAEAQLKQAAVDFLATVSEPQEKFSLVFDPVFLRKYNRVPFIGDLIWVVDDTLGIQRKIRVTTTSRKIVNEYEVDVEVADLVTAGKIDVLVNGQDSNSREIVDIDTVLKNHATLNNNIIGTLNIKQGTIKFYDLPTTSTETGFSQILIKNDTGELYRKI